MEFCTAFLKVVIAKNTMPALEINLNNNQMKNVKLILLFLLAGSAFWSCDDKESDSRDAFVGSWRVKENCTQLNEYTFTMTITKSNSDGQAILVSDFSGADDIVTVKVSGNTFTIPQQTIDGVGVSGSGTINGTTLTMSYLITGSSVNINCTATATKL